MKIHPIAFTFSIVMLGCNGSTTQDGGIVLPDAARPDAASADAGSDGGIADDGGTDTGGDAGRYCGSTLSDPGYWPRLPETCLPRCSHETLVAISTCPTQECQLQAVAMDTTPEVVVQTYFGEAYVDCGGEAGGGHYSCILWQTLSCDAEFCRDEYYTRWTCTADCDDEIQALLDCRDSSAEWDQCTIERQAECFPQ